MTLWINDWKNIQYIKNNDSLTIPVRFIDNDDSDTFDIEIISLNPNLEVKNLSVDTSGSIFNLIPKSNWGGIASIIVTVKDNSKILNSVNVDTFYVFIYNFWENIIKDTTITKDSIYINGIIEIGDSSTLNILAGTTIFFSPESGINVKGRILAEGTKTDSIKFTVPEILKKKGWKGIHYNTPNNWNDSSIFKYCVFEYGNIDNDDYGLWKSHSFPEEAGGALYIKDFDKLLR